MSEPSEEMTNELEAARTKRDRKLLANAVMEDLGVNAEGLAAIAETSPDSIREAILDGLERQQMYRNIGRQHAAQDEAQGIPGDRCCNLVCPEHQQAERTVLKDAGDGMQCYQQEGRRDYCKKGVDGAQGCMFRMAEHPPSDPFSRIPSHREAIRMLMRAGLMQPDEFGHFNGTDFAQHEATRKLWFAYLQALVDLGKIPPSVPENWGDRGDYARKLLLEGKQIP